MKGRLEHTLRTENNINCILKDKPQYLTDYYYSIQVSKEPMTCLEYLRKISRFLDFINKDIQDITDGDIGRYFSHISRVGVNGDIREASFAYKQSTWSALNQFFNYCFRKHIISDNPMDLIERPKNKDHVNRIFLSMEDLNSILEAVKNGAGNSTSRSKQKKWRERDLLIMFLFMNTGMRKTALSEINVSDISFDDKTLVVTDKRNKTQIYHLTEEMEKAIKVWLSKRESLLNGKKEDALFISSRKTRLSERSVFDLVYKYSEEALGFPISPHKLRAAFVSLYYKESGNDIKATCQAVGHANIETTSLYIVKNNNPRTDALHFMSKSLKI